MRDLTQGSITRHLLQLSGFIAVSMFFQTLYYLVDLYFVSNLGKEAIAGVSMAGNLMLATMAITQMLGVGTTSLIAQAAGRKDQRDAQSVFNQSFVLSIFTGFVVLISGLALRMTYCRALSSDAGTIREGAAYLLWFIPAMALQFAFVAMGSALRGTGIVKPTMIVQVLTVIINIVLAPVLIAGWGTGHPLGAQGAALATLAAMLVGVVALTVYFVNLESFVGFDRSQWGPQPGVWKRIFAIGLPAGGEFGVLSLFTGIVFWIIQGFGAEAQAGYGIGQRVMQSMFLPVMAVSFAASPLAGQNFGARKANRVRQTFYSAATIGSVLMVIVTFACHISPGFLIRLFSHEPGVVDYGSEYLRIISWGFFASGLVFTSSGMFQAMGNSWPPLGVSLTRLAVFAAPAIWLARHPGLRLSTIWYMTLGTGIIQCLVVILLLHREFRRKLNF